MKTTRGSGDLAGRWIADEVRRLSIFLLVSIQAVAGTAATSPSLKPAVDSIRSEDLLRHIKVLASERYVREKGIKPRARILATTSVGTEPLLMLTGPTPASQKALRMAGMDARDIDLWEINEAFAGVVLQTIRALGIDPDRVNVNGGSIALGHPLGATGAMLLGTALDELERSDKRTALVTLCIGGGQGIATILERL